MKKITATTSLTFSFERRAHALERSQDVSRTVAATKGYSLEASGLGGEFDLSTPGTQPRVVLQMVESLYGRRGRWLARPLACAPHLALGLLDRDPPRHPPDSRPIDAAAWAARTVSVGGCPHHPLRIGVLGVQPVAVAAHHRTRVAGHRSHLARVSPTAAGGLERLSGSAGHPQQSTASIGFDRAALLERFASAMVLSGLSRQLRPSRLCRVSAQTRYGTGLGVCRARLATVGVARQSASRQQRCVRADQSSRRAQSLCALGLAGRCGTDFHSRTRAVAQWFGRAVQWLAARAIVGDPIACPGSSAAGTGGDDDNLFPRAYPSPAEFPNHGPHPSNPGGTHLAPRLRRASTTLAGDHWPGRLPPARPALGPDYRVGSEIAGGQTLCPAVCHGDPLYSNHDRQSASSAASTQAISLSIRRQAETVSDHMADSFHALLSTLR